MSWRLDALAFEAFANLRADAARSLLVLAAGVLVFGGLAFLELHQASSLLSFESEYVAAGGYIAIATAQGGVSPSRCQELNRLPGVIAAGGDRNEGQATFTQAPGVLYQQFGVTSEILRVWDPEFVPPPADGGRFYLSGGALASELGLRSGLPVAQVNQRPALLSQVLNVTERAPQSDRALFEVIPPSGAVDECWVEFTPSAYPGSVDALPAWFATGNVTPTVRPYISPDQFSRNPASELASRPQRNGWIAGAALLVGVVLLTAWFRRSTLGIYLALGTSRSSLMCMLAIELFVLATAAWLAGMLWAIALQRALGDAVTFGALHLAVVTSLSAALATLVAAPLVSSLVARGDISALLKDR